MIYIPFQIWNWWWNYMHHFYLVLNKQLCSQVYMVCAITFRVLQDKLQRFAMFRSQYLTEIIKSGQKISGLNMHFLLWCLLHFVITCLMALLIFHSKEHSSNSGCFLVFLLSIIYSLVLDEVFGNMPLLFLSASVNVTHFIWSVSLICSHK